MSELDVGYTILILIGGLILLVLLNSRQLDENHQIDEDDNYIPTVKPAHEDDGDYWCPLCGYHATNLGYYNAHLMNEHKNN